MDHGKWATASDVAQCINPVKAMKIGRTVKTNQKWKEKKLDVMKHLILYKAEQCEHFRKELVSSGSKELVENTVNNFWGRGENNHGQNMMGRILMDVRAELRATEIPGNYKSTPSDYSQSSYSKPNPGVNLDHKYASGYRRPQHDADEPYCWYCGEYGHISENCRKGLIQCWICQEWGHKQKMHYQ